MVYFKPFWSYLGLKITVESVPLKFNCKVTIKVKGTVATPLEIEENVVSSYFTRVFECKRIIAEFYIKFENYKNFYFLKLF